MKITFSEKILRDDKIISFDKKKKEDKPQIISGTIPKFIQDHKGTWIKNQNGLIIKLSSFIKPACNLCELFYPSETRSIYSISRACLHCNHYGGSYSSGIWS